MFISSKCTSITTEYHIQKWGNGVKLVHPEQLVKTNLSRSLHDASKQPLSLCLLDTDSIILGINELGADMGGFISEKDVVGKSLFDLFERKNADALRQHDLTILNTNKICIAEQQTINNRNEKKNHLTIDAPWYDHSDRLIGMIGFSTVIGHGMINPILNYLRDLGLLTPETPKLDYSVELTKREKSCIEHLLNSRSCKQIAQQLKLSPRTIEHVIENIKKKFGARTKLELTEILQKLLQTHIYNNNGVNHHR